MSDSFSFFLDTPRDLYPNVNTPAGSDVFVVVLLFVLVYAS